MSVAVSESILLRLNLVRSPLSSFETQAENYKGTQPVQYTVFGFGNFKRFCDLWRWWRWRYALWQSTSVLLRCHGCLPRSHTYSSPTTTQRCRRKKRTQPNIQYYARTRTFALLHRCGIGPPFSSSVHRPPPVNSEQSRVSHECMIKIVQVPVLYRYSTVVQEQNPSRALTSCVRVQ